MLHVENICLIPKHKRNWKMKNWVTTFGSDSREDSMVQNDKDVDALMHLKITIVELYNNCCQGLTTVYNLATFCKKDWIDVVLWRMTTVIWKERRQRIIWKKQKKNSNFDEAISKKNFYYYVFNHFLTTLKSLLLRFAFSSRDTISNCWASNFTVFKFAGCVSWMKFYFKKSVQSRHAARVMLEERTLLWRLLQSRGTGGELKTSTITVVSIP